jgi:hypothetical protein
MFENSSLGLYDSANGQTVTADKVVDISYLCKRSKQVILKFANAERGRIVQICDLYETGVDMGMTIHYFVNEMTREQFENELKLRASILGCESTDLVQVIFDNK